MPALPSELRSLLDRKVQEARDAAEEAARASLSALAVDQGEPFGSLGPEQRRLRNALRAKARQLGGGSQTRGFHPLVEEVAYEQWHRMLFARFLAENGLLMHPDGVPVTLEDCAELAREEGEADAWMLAARYASAMLPGIFRTDDPSVQVRFSPEGRDQLERILSDLPPAAFIADDALGWVYQFWQTKKKKEVNASGRKIGGAHVAPVTQLFTEDYMVRFLVENSLGAWWAARHPASSLVKQFEYLRFRDDGTPAAGTFPGWPERAAEVTVMDPCCGSGHFLVAAFHMLRQMRMEEEGMGVAEAADAVLRSNLFGLEIDARCTQLAAFALAFAAWKVGGYREIPVPNVACSGIAVEGQLGEWTKLAGDDANLTSALERLYHLLRTAPELGSLIDFADVPVRDRMFAVDPTIVQPLLEYALASDRNRKDPVTAVLGQTARATARAAVLLGRTYTLVATNVPYLGSNKQDEVLQEFCTVHHPESKSNLAIVFLERCRQFSVHGGSYVLVTPQIWLFLGSYRKLRERFLKGQTWDLMARLGPGAFDTISGEVVDVVLVSLSNSVPSAKHIIANLDCSKVHAAHQKAEMLRTGSLMLVPQADQLRNPDARVTLEAHREGKLLGDYAHASEGLSTGDRDRYIQQFWEQPDVHGSWEFFQTSAEGSGDGGLSEILFWQQGRGELSQSTSARVQGQAAWEEQGVLISRVKSLRPSVYSGAMFDKSCVALIPLSDSVLPALRAYCRSQDFETEVRRLDKKPYVTTSVFLKIPFDSERWCKAAEAECGPNSPLSNDPTQWIFNRQLVCSTLPLQVAVARLLGYRWPKQEPDALDFYADRDGIVCLPPVAGEQPAAERLRVLLATAFGGKWSQAEQGRLLAAVAFGGKGLDEWLRDGFFEQHCRLFHNRPFIWHVWDGRKDGFSALVNCHKLDANGLNRLIYTYLGVWISTQRADRDAGVPSAEGRLVAALELQKKFEAIRDGEPPYDIYVRWKPLHCQPMGWNPDLNDGVRLNIRPFVTAGVLRSRFTINWNKDRGTNPDGSERRNDLHFRSSDKQAARKTAGTV